MLMALAASAAEPPRGPFRLDSDEFPIGMYSIDSPGAMAQAESFGIDYVQSYGTGRDDKPESIAKDVAYLDLAWKHGRRVAFQFAGRKLVDRPDGRPSDDADHRRRQGPSGVGVLDILRRAGRKAFAGATPAVLSGREEGRAGNPVCDLPLLEEEHCRLQERGRLQFVRLLSGPTRDVSGKPGST